jgi:hypothetical protein
VLWYHGEPLLAKALKQFRRSDSLSATADLAIANLEKRDPFGKVRCMAKDLPPIAAKKDWRAAIIKRLSSSIQIGSL